MIVPVVCVNFPASGGSVKLESTIAAILQACCWV